MLSFWSHTSYFYLDVNEVDPAIFLLSWRHITYIVLRCRKTQLTHSDFSLLWESEHNDAPGHSLVDNVGLIRIYTVYNATHTIFSLSWLNYFNAEGSYLSTAEPLAFAEISERAVRNLFINNT